ncbi:MAG: hypothetical protein WA728_03400, partial [Xanthobacteraceae bacterium]
MDTWVDRAYRRSHLWLAALALTSNMIGHLPAHAEVSASLPPFKACLPADPAALPPRWRAIGLMLPFEQGQLDVGEFVFDGSLPAMRATVYGLQSGAVDVLITDSDTYLIRGPHDSPTDCISLGPRLGPPSAQWLSEKSVCVGESPVASRPVQWWQKIGTDVARHWVSTETRLPLRSWFLRRSLDPAIIGDYAMTYFPTFTPLPQTDLMALRDFCVATAKPISREIAPTPTARELMAFGNQISDAERQKQIDALIPGLSYQACSRMTPVRWPDRFVATGIITPIQTNEEPHPTVIVYDWSEAPSMLTVPFYGNPLTLLMTISLKKRIGYRMMAHPTDKPLVCEPIFPGAVKPDWMTLASCQCRGVIDHNPALNPDDETQILSCPIKMQGRRVMWNWYTAQGRPIMFTEAAPFGDGFMLVDYID